MLLTLGATLFNGNYRVEALVGQGASAEVYRALHLGLRLPCALKVLRKGESGVGTLTMRITACAFNSKRSWTRRSSILTKTTSA